ncbi:M48 family metallopeptidase [Rhodobacteraceae bacterium NNCM2]|nr:M48 family metallopeptidase [Coraliihabitans acroporae]
MTDFIRLDDLDVDVLIKVNARARRFTLRLADPGKGAVLTLPPGVPMTEAHSFLMRHRDWLSRAIARQPKTIAVVDGAPLPVDGEKLVVETRDGPRRAPVIADDRLVVQGKGAPGPRIAAWLKERARARLGDAAHHYAGRLGRRLNGVALKDTRSRWGSCSTTGRINFSWRLAMAPRDVQNYVAAHEAAHLVEMNHSDRYWSVLESILPDYEIHRQWLKAEGRALHSYMFEVD